MYDNHYNLAKRVKELEQKLAKEQAEKHYYIGYIKGIAEAFDEERKARILEWIKKQGKKEGES